MSTEKERELKRKLQSFLNDLAVLGTLRVGSHFNLNLKLQIDFGKVSGDPTHVDLTQLCVVQGFRYFSSYLRGREELALTVLNQSDSAGACVGATASLSGSFNAAALPYDTASLLISLRTQKRISGFGHMDVGLPPASPCEKEPSLPGEGRTLFLVAGYARYGCPYVWARSSHERLLRLDASDASVRDNPLKLRTTSAWPNADVHVWDVVAEVVRLCAWPAPRNPLALDMAALHALPPTERGLATGALLAFLHRVCATADRSKPLRSAVLEELPPLTQLHMESMRSVMTNSSPPPRAATPPSPRPAPFIGRPVTLATQSRQSVADEGAGGWQFELGPPPLRPKPN
ncbi:uncharacterized protein LOC116952565 isoform X1 [Petromyzon marinus]|uniref:Uncharacterized protein LOC116952565 isoform X1 n=1 Tax=Petromyzon marinus TaxID=7757 RepID=A0AAJ7XC86_PETMA|nr:uncharacterized protein LOC116952565 isoform X1 [Petromyzon marinus]